jgi:hypothetical protein
MSCIGILRVQDCVRIMGKPEAIRWCPQLGACKNLFFRLLLMLSHFLEGVVWAYR